MSPNGGVTQSIATAEVKLPQVSKTARDAHIYCPWHQAPSTPWGNYAAMDAKIISTRHPAPLKKR